MSVKQRLDQLEKSPAYAQSERQIILTTTPRITEAQARAAWESENGPILPTDSLVICNLSFDSGI